MLTTKLSENALQWLSVELECRAKRVGQDILTSSQGILEDLLKTQELQDAQVDSGMESESSLVWT
jgi:hypothetical protein